jgi:hypothetical protein
MKCGSRKLVIVELEHYSGIAAIDVFVFKKRIFRFRSVKDGLDGRWDRKGGSVAMDSG